MAVFPIPLGDQGLYGGRGISRVPAEYLLKAENIAFDDGQIRKEGGAAIYNDPMPYAFTERANPKNFALMDVVWTGVVFVAVGAADGTDSYIVTSPDGITWTEQAPTVSKNIQLNSVSYIQDFASSVLLIAVGNADGGDGYLLTSQQGTLWAEQANPKNIALNAVAMNNSIAVAVGAADGTDSYIITSTNSTAWTERAPTVSKNISLNGVLWVPDLSLFVAVGNADGGDAYILTSPDGITWTERTNAKNFNLQDLAWNGSLLVAVGDADGADAYILTSTDGVTWTERTNPKNFGLNVIFWLGTAFYAFGAADGTDAYAVMSADGTTWAEVVNPKNFALQGASFNGNKFAVVGNADGTDAYIITADFASAAVEIAPTVTKFVALADVTWTGSNFVAVGGPDGTDGYILTSPNGTTWAERANALNKNLTGIVFASGRLVAVGVATGTSPYILTSDDEGETWTQRTFLGDRTLYAITWNGIVYVAVGAADGTDAAILTSSDGINWTERTNPKNFNLYDVVWNGELFVAIGDYDGADTYILTSPDGSTWTERANSGTAAAYNIVWTGAQFIIDASSSFSGKIIVAETNLYFACRAPSSILTSTDGITWTSKSSTVYAQALGGNDLCVSFDGTTWFGVVVPASGLSLTNGLAFDGSKVIGVGSGITDAYIVSMTLNTNYFLGAHYWNYDGATPRIVGLDTAGRLLIDDYDGIFDTQATSGLTVTSSTFPVFVEGGKEVAANNRKLFVFTGANAVQVLSGSGSTTSNLATPPADWAAANRPTGGLIHKNRLWGYGNANDPHRLYYSLTTNHEDFTTTGAGSISVYPGEGEKIVNAISYKGYIIVFKYPKGIYVVDTTAVQVANWQVDRVNEKLGGAGQGSAAVVEEDIIFIDHSGEIRLVAGITEFGDIGSRSLSDRDDISVFIRDNYYIPSNTKWRMQYYSKKRELHIGASSNLLGINDNRMVIDFNRDTPRFRNSTRDTCLYLFTRELNGIPELMSCDNLGNIWRLDQDSKTKDGLGYVSQFQIMYTDLGIPHLDKIGQSMEIDFEPTGDVNVAVDVFWDGVYQETTTINLAGPSGMQSGRMVLSKSVPLVGDGRRVSLTFRNVNADEDFAIQGLRIIHDNAGLPEEP